MDTRPVLEYLLKVGKRLVCADGFRAHSIPVIKSMEDMPDGAYRVVNDPGKHDEAVTVQSEESLHLPKLGSLVAKDENQLAAIAIDSRFLRKSLKDIGDPFVILRIYKVPSESNDLRRHLTIESLDGECVALIMSGQVGDLLPQTRRLVDEPEPIRQIAE